MRGGQVLLTNLVFKPPIKDAGSL